jgi:hypothetical protein
VHLPAALPNFLLAGTVKHAGGFVRGAHFGSSRAGALLLLEMVVSDVQCRCGLRMIRLDAAESLSICSAIYKSKYL